MRLFLSLVATVLLGMAACLISRGADPEAAHVKVVKTIQVKECDGRQCQIVTYEWAEHGNDRQRRHYLYRAGIVIGVWCYEDCKWRTFDSRAGTWGPKTDKPPFEVPGIPQRKIGETAPLASQHNKGVDASAFRDHKESYTLDGERVHPLRALDALAKDQLSDDSSKPWLIVIGTDEERRPVQDAWNSVACAEVKDQFKFWSVPADHWSVKGLGFTNGVSWERSDGAVLYRQANFVTADQLAITSKAALRKADPKYDPRKDADPLQPAPAPGPPTASIDLTKVIEWLKHNWLIPLGVVGLGYYVYRKETAK